MTWQSEARKILTTILGLVLSLAGGFFLYLEMSGADRHPTHVYVFSGFIAVGMFIVAPSVIGGALSKAFSYLPQIKVTPKE